MNKSNEIINSLNQLFEIAKKDNLWFYCTYQDLWFSPKELKEAQKEGRFIWGAENWELRNPQELITQFEQLICGYKKQKFDLIDRIHKSKITN